MLIIIALMSEYVYFECHYADFLYFEYNCAGVIMLSVLAPVDPAFVMLPCSQSDVIVTVNLLNHFN